MADRIICAKCGCELESAKTELSYLGHTFRAELPRCPKCLRVYMPKELVKDRVARVEASLEDK